MTAGEMITSLRLVPYILGFPALSQSREYAKEKKMSDSGIVNLSEYSKSRRNSISVEHLKLLHESRDMLSAGISRELSGQTEAMESSLLGLADHAPLAETRDYYFHALTILNRQGAELFQACKQALIQTINAQWGETGAQKDALGELSLMDDTDYETTLAVNKSSSRLRFNCAEELVGLDARMGVLLGRSPLTADENPLGPKILCEALLDGMSDLGIDGKVQLVLLNQFDLVLYPELPVIYQEINRFLLGKGILPDFKAGIRSRPDQAGRVKSRQPEQTELLGLFEKMVTGQGTGGVGPGGLTATVAGGQTSGAGAALLGISMLEALNRLQVGALNLPGGVTIDLRSSLAGGFPNVVRELQQSPAMLSASQLETVMIDAVAMLFDYLFEDQAIPEHLKQLIAQLQVPVLKVAILDRGFFTQRDHPARRVLDMIATLAVQPAGQAGPDPLQQEVEAVIQRIVTEFEQDASVFEQACAALAELQTKREQEMEAGMADSVAEIQRAERSEVAETIVRDHVRRALAEQPAPEVIVTFLRDFWAPLLVREYIEEGESSPHLSAHIETMRELLWSVQNKPDMDSRLMMVRFLPGLLKRLREGVDQVGMPAEAVEGFFAGLVTLHANAVRPSSLTVPLPDAEALLDDLPSDEADIENANLDEPRYAEPLPAIEDEYLLCAQSLQKGDRLQLCYDDGTTNWVHVVWVSGLKGNYLFADMNGHNMFSISPHRLADKMRSGQAVLAARESATESAFGKLIAFFKQRVMPA
jgi:hypothetical protein